LAEGPGQDVDTLKDFWVTLMGMVEAGMKVGRQNQIEI
jgi:hypothetical protein